MNYIFPFYGNFRGTESVSVAQKKGVTVDRKEVTGRFLCQTLFIINLYMTNTYLGTPDSSPVCNLQLYSYKI